MIKQVLLAMVSLSVLCSCKDYVEELAPKKEEKAPVEVKKINKNVLIEKSEIKDQLSLGKVNPGEILEIKFKGKKFVPQYTDVFERRLQSSWMETRCYRDSGVGDGHSVRVCENYDEVGSCVHLYRETLPLLESPLNFEASPNEMNLKIKIGPNIYPLGEAIQNDGSSMSTQFRVSKEMLNESNEAFVYVDLGPAQDVRMGFQGFGHCEGQGQKNFRSGGYQTYDVVDMRPKYEFHISAWMIQE